ncbi:dihydrofolate reductase [Paenibacillus sp. IB182496]|uniref:Dihydrofolate reductase n=1 Tax=Paenibacillus sabuli TaxID=2772509 RepID=A0A927BTW5_9BACL|nr:dihydrofolate reductase family protein [Paenibacillus sabuli]MBD2845439.1 dihydrofolate reductase [Paenibacillus sabuli]
MTRKIILDLAVTLDGFIEGKNGEIDWCIMDEEMGFADFVNRIDTILYGRKSYELWRTFDSEAEGSDADQAIGDLIRGKEKVVFSRTKRAIDDGVLVINDRVREQVEHIKAQPGRDLWLYGGASLISTFIELELIDEYRLSVHPVVLGEGKPLFVDVKKRLNLKLIETKTFGSGVVQLVYRSA